MIPNEASILVIEDEASMRLTLSVILEDTGYRVTRVSRGSEAVELLKSGGFDIIVSDIRLPDTSGTAILEMAKEIDPDIAVILITGYASVETAVNAVNEGAYAYFVKPVNMDEMKTTIANALRQQRLSRENKKLVDDLQRSNSLLIKTNQELIEKGKALETASHFKSRFLANMSHELRTPLNAVIGFSELMLDGTLGKTNDTQQQCLVDIHNSGQHLLALINDVLDLSRIEAGRLEMNLEKLDLAEVISEVVPTIKPMLDKNDLKLNISLEPGLPAVSADRNRLKQIIINLMSNAIKFTLPGGRITIKATRRDDWCRVSVIDNGIGIRQEDQARVFEAFTQLDTHPEGRKEGTGLGLTITRHFVEMGSGRLWLASEYGKGSNFTFTLPVATAE
ncbi:MAG: ATP-binding protein [Dehalococcoidales bacterium]|jgi:signal transduction histidine kinase